MTSMMELCTLGLQQSCFASSEQVVLIYAANSACVVLVKCICDMLARVSYWDCMCQVCYFHVPQSVCEEAANQKCPGPRRLFGLCLFYNWRWIVSFSATNPDTLLHKGRIVTVATEHKQNIFHWCQLCRLLLSSLDFNTISQILFILPVSLRRLRLSMSFKHLEAYVSFLLLAVFLLPCFTSRVLFCFSNGVAYSVFRIFLYQPD